LGVSHEVEASFVAWGGTLILAAGLALGSAPVVSAAGAEVDLDVVTKVVTAYQDLLDSHWTDSNCSLSSCVNASSSVFASSGDKKSQRGSSFGGSSKKGRDERKDSGKNPKFTKAETELLELRDYMKDFGLPIKTAKSTVEVVDAKLNADGKITASVVVGTTKTYDDDDGTPSYVVDTHTLTLAPNPENLFAVIEDIVDPAPVEDHSVEDLMNNPTDVPMESIPFENILGVGLDGKPRQVASVTDLDDGDVKFSLPVSRQKGYSAGTHFVANEQNKQGKPDTKKMVDYALLWTSQAKQPKNVKDDVINPAYDNLGTNCANFASQALEAGGWQRKEGTYGVRDLNSWSPRLKDLNAKEKPSHTWSLARDLYKYVLKNSPYHPMLAWEHESAQAGDLIFTDWDPNGKADGQIDHVMVVTGTKTLKKNVRIPTISQKTTNRNNVPITETYKALMRGGSKPEDVKWYAVTTR